MKARGKLNAFLYKNRNKGVRNLMLYVGVGNVIVYLLTMLNQANPFFYSLLYFNPEAILSGQVWRLFTYPLVYLCECRPFLGFISLLFFYWCGSTLEQYWGTLRFNLFYLCGVLLTDAAGLIFALAARAELGYYSTLFTSLLGFGFVGYLNLSLILALSTAFPDQQVRLYFIIPVKMKWLAWIDLGFMLYDMIRILLMMLKLGASYFSLYLFFLVPLAAIVNYLLFFGKQAANLLPDKLRHHSAPKTWQQRVVHKADYSATGLGRNGRSDSRAQARFRCTVCGRTELSNPGLEFRYCSKCAGYRCYCQDHIQNHVHITE